jgi:GNAT superfamily N-acetyltransferase
MGEIILRVGTAADIDGVSGLFARSRAIALPFVPVLHSAEEDLAFFGGYLAKGRVTLAELEGELVGFVIETDGWIEHLYLEPSLRGQGIGSTLVDDVKTRQDRLEVWCFEENLAGRAFYAAQDFAEVRRTEGDNEAGLPDILFVWEE